jgi:hypothetical protein
MTLACIPAGDAESNYISLIAQSSGRDIGALREAWNRARIK